MKTLHFHLFPLLQIETQTGHQIFSFSFPYLVVNISSIIFVDQTATGLILVRPTSKDLFFFNGGCEAGELIWSCLL